MSDREVQEISDKLRSDKIKTRQEGITDIRRVFSTPGSVERFNKVNGEPKPSRWVIVFQALFMVVQQEQLVVQKKSSKAGTSNAALRRLSEAASTIRWLVEQTVKLIGKPKVTRVIFDHTIPKMVLNKELFAPVALDYIKLIRCMLSWPPHLEHLENETWIELVQLGFNVVLQEPLKQSLESKEAGWLALEDRRGESHVSDEEDDELPTVSPGTRKRRRGSDLPTTPARRTPQLSKRKLPQIMKVSLEQTEFAALLSILLRSPAAPFHLSQYEYLPSAILSRLYRFIEVYPSDSSLMNDYLSILSSTLSHVSLNKKSDVQRFGRSSWNGLLSLWGTKDRRLKEGLVAILRILFPYVVVDMDGVNSACQTSFDCYDALLKLWAILAGEADSRWGVDGISLDAIRLEVMSGSCGNQPFAAKTFRAGSNFDEVNALAWAILQLQADVAAKLYELSESIYSPPTPAYTHGDSKRTRLENPIKSLLASIAPSSASSRPYHLQVLLFLADRHWNHFHGSLKEEITDTLLQFVSVEDSTVQSWVFLTLAAIAFSEHLEQSTISNTSSDAQPADANVWPSIWSHAIRRVCIPNTCRAACHAGHILIVSLYNQHSSASPVLPPQRFLLDIESLAKDIDVQGPSYPYDSVCSFLSQCLTLASQDVRLYRMHFEDKVLAWLMDNWKGTIVSKDKLALNTIQDVILLLQTVCGLRLGSIIDTRVLMPKCWISEQMTTEVETKLIRDYMLEAYLPQPKQSIVQQSQLSSDANAWPVGEKIAKFETGLPPRGRERKVKAFFSRTLDTILSAWDTGDSSNFHPTAETARATLDMAVVALIFETQLSRNGTDSDRTVLKSAAKLISIIVPFLKGSRWSWTEKALIALGLEPLVSLDGFHSNSSSQSWTALLSPGRGSGIRSQTLEALLANEARRPSENIDVLKVLWQNPDVRESFDMTITSIKEILHGILGERTGSLNTDDVMDIDSQDDFAPIHTSVSQQLVNSTQANGDDTHFLQYVTEVCIMFITTGPVLQSASGEPVRDKTLTELVLRCAGSRKKTFLLLFPILFRQVKHKMLHLTRKTFDEFLDALEGALLDYEYRKSDLSRTLVIHALDNTLDLWTSSSTEMEDIKAKILQLYTWLSRSLKEHTLPSWESRDAFAQFLAHYIQHEPMQQTLLGIKDKCLLPGALLPVMNSDADIRVRFRVAVLNAQLLEKADELECEPQKIYNAIIDNCTKETDNYEHMITRFICLGNIMIIDSGVRRGAYWHLLEICSHTNLYSPHIEAVLMGVSQRLGLANLSALCEAYSTQLAWSIRRTEMKEEQESNIKKAESDFFRFPPQLLGYRDRRQCAEMTLRAFAPSYMVTDGRELFERHCLFSQKDVNKGLRESFADIVGFQIVKQLHECGNDVDDLDSLLQQVTFEGEEFEENLRQNVEGVVTFTLSTLYEQQSPDGDPVVLALRTEPWDRKAADIFSSLLQYRHPDSHHLPNLPSYSASVVLRGIIWLTERLPGSVTPSTTYHVLHELLARIHRSPFVNEQLRLLKSLSLWVAIQATHFQDGTILYTLTHGAVTLLAQSDLAKSAQSILEWAFSCYRKYGIKDTRLSSILLRIACTAHDYSLAMSGTAITELGNSLIQWIDTQIVYLSNSKILKSLTLRALAAWPYTLSSSLLELCYGINSDDLSRLLGDPRVSSDKFRLVRRLREHKLMNDYDSDRFFNFDFWRIKESIPSDGRMQMNDIEAFISLLELHHGQFSGFSIDQRVLFETIQDMHRPNPRKKTEETPVARDCVVIALLKMLQRDMESQVYTAYNTLHLIMAVMPSDTRPSIRISEEQLKELEYLRVYRRFPRELMDRDLQQELEMDIYTESISDFPRWIALVTTLLSDCLSVVDPVLGQLNEILRSDVVFAEDIFPVLVQTLLLLNKSGHGFASCRTDLSQYFKSILLAEQCDVRCLRSIIDAVLHLRYFAPGEGGALAYNSWLDMDFMLLARKAIVCGAYTTALLFLELAAEQDSLTDDSSCEQVLYEIYAHIDEPDGFYGINTNDLQQFLIKRFHHEQQWEKAFRFHGAALEAGKPSANETDGLMRSFHSFGFDRLAIDTLQSSYRNTDDLSVPSSMTYRLGWRTETWDLPAQTQYTSGASLYQCLRAIYRERDQTAVDSEVRQALCREMSRLRDLGPENIIEIHQVTQDLMSIHQISLWRRSETQQRLEKRQVLSDHWNEFVDIDFAFGFSDLENVMATRLALVRSVRKREERQQIGNLIPPFTLGLIDVEKRSLLRLSEAARKANQVQVALNAVVRAQMLEEEPSFDVSHEFAHVLWLQKEEKLSVQYLLKLVRQDDDKAESEISSERKALLLSRLGSWTSEACLEKATDIWDRYFGRAISILERSLENTANPQVHASVYHECAIFASRQYYAVLKSPDALRWKVYVDRKTQEIAHRNKEIKQTQNQSRQNALEHEQRRAQKVLKEDSEMFKKHIISRDTFLKQAIEMYSRCLQASDEFDNDAAIRLCSLWFANFDDEQVLIDTIPSALERIASGKMVFLSHQLTARLAKPATRDLSINQKCLQSLLLRMCTEHPFHSLYQVYCVRPTGTPSRRQSGRQTSSTPSTQTERVDAATDIFNRLYTDATNAQRVQDIEYLCNACLEWAKFPIKGEKSYTKRKQAGFKIPDNMKIRAISNLRVPVSTYHTPVDRTMRYDDCVWINGYDSTFDTAGGINLPKITVCVGSDGNKYKQLFKGEGNDDLRQDAVMEQVFELVNTVLELDRETQRRKLKIREYKVIPLDTQAGLLEFVGNTTPLRSWLDKAHPRYRPTDWSPQDCTKKLLACAGLGSEKQLEAFQEMQKNFRPVMRHYFTEKHKNPTSWFTMRLNYIRSVATTSIVGHVLGLGDRHTSNILLDTSSGEVVHIDLGIAFDQGKLLPVPERVPFRMTADMVDGMGISGTQGVFQRCAEETLRVLREGSEVIMTVLEVFKHDPLHSWVASDVKVKQAQNDVVMTNLDTYLAPLGIGIDMSSGSAEEAADRALNSVSRKLDKSLSVETVVNELIAEATDLQNLATIYHGWGPHY